MKEFTQQADFRNNFDIKSFLVESAYRGVISDDRVDNMLNSIKEEKEMKTRQEYLQGCRESDIRALANYENLKELADRVAQYGNDRHYEEVKEWLVNYIVENNLIDDEELSR